MEADILVVGAGFAGSVCARVLAEAGRSVLLIDKRNHVGGNAYDRYDENGVLVHPYGPHIFHTNGKRILEWLSKFTGWRFYEHRVLASVDGQLLPIPINRVTLSRLYGVELDDAGAEAWLSRCKEERAPIKTSEDVVLNSVGRDLCEKFFRGYTRKQWGLDLSDLSAGVAARIPTRTNDDDRYFSDTYQFMPVLGYTELFRSMLSHPRIDIRLCADFFELRQSIEANHIVYTGPIDTYFDYQFGNLQYRSLRFEHEHFPNVGQYQAVGTVNYPNEHDYTRVSEFKHITGQHHTGTSIVREYPQSHGEPYYPVPRPSNEEQFKKYEALAKKAKSVTFVGRLAQYRYYNMDQVVGAALASAEKILTST